ncbi:YVTN repeat-like/Quino protein amine dehydrogenase [Suillus weaverae]|nr:YVTN repeat-like/Quino protein amine dehydrogenase [Suillus weaverae]
MASVSTKAAATKSILTPSITLRGHRDWISSISYFPDGQRMISGSHDETARQWDLKVGKEIEEARGVCERGVYAVAVSRDGRWVVTGGGDLKACEVETGIVKTFGDRTNLIDCIDISADNTLLAGGSESADMEPGHWQTRGREVTHTGKRLEVWDIKTQKLDARVGEYDGPGATFSPVFWTNNDKTIIAALSFTKDGPIKTIYEFDASTLETVGTPFEGHTDLVTGLTLSSDGALLASTSFGDAIQLWAFESRQLLGSFTAQNPLRLTFSPNSRQLAYTTSTINDCKICICDTPLDILAQARMIARKKSTLNHLLHSDATRHPPAGHRRPPISAIPMVQRPPSTRDPQQPSFLNKLLPFSRRTNSSRPGRKDHPRDPLDLPATSPLPSSLSGQAAPRFDHFEISSPSPPLHGITQSLRQHVPFLAPRHSLAPPVVEVAPGRKFTRLAAVKLPEYKKVDDTRHPCTTVPQENDSSDVDSLPDVHWCKAFLCYMSCWSHGTLRMPPRWRLERVDIPCQDGTANSSRLASQSQAEAGPSRPAVTSHLEAQSSSI